MSDPNHIPTHQTTAREPSVVHLHSSYTLCHPLFSFSNRRHLAASNIARHSSYLTGPPPPPLTPLPDAYTLLGRTNAARRGVRASAPARGRATVRSRSNRASAATATTAAAKRWHIWR